MTECFTKHVAVKIEPSNTCESICCYKDMVLIGTKQGNILFYRISYDEKLFNTKNYVSHDFHFMLREFPKKPILQIHVVEEFGLVLSLADGNIFVHRFNDYRLIHIIENKKVIRFSVEVSESKVPESANSRKKVTNSNISNRIDVEKISRSILNESNEKTTPQMRICLSTKKKLIIMNWIPKESKFVDTDRDIKLSESVKAVQLFFDYIFIGTKTEYSMISITGEETSHTQSKTFSMGKCQEPYLLRIADMMAIKIDDVIELIDRDGNLLSDGTLKWSFVPSSLLYHPPFAIAVCEKSVEVRMVTPTLFIQSIPFDNASQICRYMDRIYVLVDRVLFVLKGRPRTLLVQMYSDNEDFELSLMLAKTAPLVGENIIESTKINIQYSLNLFKNRQFEKAFNIFIELLIEPESVLNLFPSLCPDKIAKQVTYVSASKNFTEEETIEAIRALIDYLVRWRYKLLYCKTDTIDCKTMSDGGAICKTKNKLEQIVDTSLLKCYLIINSPLITPLLKQRNFCHLEEAKKCLSKHDKWQELILLYESHDCHNEALMLLFSLAMKPSSPLFGIQPTLRYMKNLNPDYINLIYEYGDWILAKSPMDWLNIFTRWDYAEKNLSNDEKKKFPSYKENVLKHLKAKAPEIVIPFLERSIYDNKTSDDFDFDDDTVDGDNTNCDDATAGIPQNQSRIALLPFEENEPLPIKECPSNDNVLHTSYIVALIQKVLSMRTTQLLDVNIKNELKNPSPDSKYVFQLRMRLKKFLESSKAKYSTDVLSEFPYDAFYEERALVLARAGKDEQALTLWIYLLNNWPQALSHCNNTFYTNRDIFFKLLNICVEPSDPAAIGIVIPSLCVSLNDERKYSICNNRFTPKLDKALEILKLYGEKLSILPTIKLLSSSFKISDLLPFIQNSLRKQSTLLNQAVYQRNLQFSNKLQSNLNLCNSSKKYFIMNQDSKCSVCNKNMGPSALARYPDGTLLHYGCCKDLLKSTV